MKMLVSLVQRLKNELPYNTLFYLDPPYYVKGKGLYLNYYNDTDHQNIANTISEIANCKWIVSYDNVTIHNQPIFKNIDSNVLN